MLVDPESLLGQPCTHLLNEFVISDDNNGPLSAGNVLNSCAVQILSKCSKMR